MNGRKINLISLDDGYSPPKTVEQTSQLIEREQVAFIFGTFGGVTNLATRQYLNENRIPQLFLAAAADIFADPRFPWTMGLNPALVTEAHIYAKHIRSTKPDAKIGVLFQMSFAFSKTSSPRFEPGRVVRDVTGSRFFASRYISFLLN